MKIIIPFQLPGLNEYTDSQRKNKYNGNKFKKFWQGMVARTIRRQLKGRALREPVVLHYTWVEKNRNRDKDNICGFGHKVIQDALVSVKALRNDGWKNIDGFTDDFKVDEKHPRIEIEIEEAGNAKM